jgi:hypothetical protein
VADQGFVAEAGTEPGSVMITPYEGDIRLLHQVVDYFVSTLAPVPAVARDDQFIDRKVSDDSTNEVDKMQDASSSRELIDDRFNVSVISFRRRRMKYLGQEFPVFRWQNASSRFQAPPRSKHSHDLKKIMKCSHRVRLLILGIANPLFKAFNDFGWIENQGQEFLELFGWHSILEQFFDQRPQCPRSVIDHMAELFMLPVNIADYVNGSLWQRQFSA